MTTNDAQGPSKATGNTASCDWEAQITSSSLGIPFPEFNVLPEFVNTSNISDEDEVTAQAGVIVWNGASIPVVCVPGSGVGAPGSPLIVIQAVKRASFF